MEINEFFGTLQESVTYEWRKHLQSKDHAEHVILDEYYKEMPEKIDALIEAYQANHDPVKDYKNLLNGKDLSPIEYLNRLQSITREGRELMEESELESLCDDILSLIDSTLYKLKELVKESRSPENQISLSRYLEQNLN